MGYQEIGFSKRSLATIGLTHLRSCSDPSPPALSGGRGWVRWVISFCPHIASLTPTTSPSHRRCDGPHPLPRKCGGEGVVGDERGGMRVIIGMSGDIPPYRMS